MAAICWERDVPLAFHLCCFNFNAVLVVRVPFQFGVWDRMWNLIVSVPFYLLCSEKLSCHSFIQLSFVLQAINRSISNFILHKCHLRCCRKEVRQSMNTAFSEGT